MSVFACDLHTHTVNSDGNDTPAELVANAAARGVRVIAVTDHDVLPPDTVTVSGERIDFAEYALDKGVVALRGIEFSCQTEVEDTHLVGLGCDFGNPAIGELVERIAKSKTMAYVELLKRLKKKGMPIGLDELLSYGKPINIEQLQKKRIFDMMALKGYAHDWKSAKLMVRDDEYLSVKREKPEAADVITSVMSAGGVAVLAHPFLIDEEFVFRGVPTRRRDFIEFLAEKGLAGIEACYPYDKTSCKDKRPNREIWDEIKKTYRERLFFSGGSDYHNDRKKGTPNPRELGECGISLEEFKKSPLYVFLSQAQKDFLDKTGM